MQRTWEKIPIDNKGIADLSNLSIQIVFVGTPGDCNNTGGSKLVREEYGVFVWWGKYLFSLFCWQFVDFDFLTDFSSTCSAKPDFKIHLAAGNH